MVYLGVGLWVVMRSGFGTSHLSRSPYLTQNSADAGSVDWLFAEAGKGTLETEAPAAPEPSTSQAPVRDYPLHQTNVYRRPPNGAKSFVLRSVFCLRLIEQAWALRVISYPAQQPGDEQPVANDRRVPCAVTASARSLHRGVTGWIAGDTSVASRAK